MQQPASSPTPPRSPVGRLAPSPTGLLHVGHARSFLLAWWQMRALGGRVVLRIEDLDAQRSRAEFVDACRRDLEWLGIDWEAEVLQSTRREAHADALGRLTRAGLAYACICTRREIEAAQSAPHGDAGHGRYPGTCRERFADAAEAERAAGRPAALRLRLPDALAPVRFEDALAGPQAFDPAASVGDFPIARKGGEAAYQLAVVVDDALDGVTHVLRGDDLLASTAQQLLLHDALALPHPTWAHVPLVVDAAGQRLAKRTQGLSLAELREQGVDPRRVVRWAARSASQAPADAHELLDARAVVAAFELSRVPPGPVRFDLERT